MLKCLGKLSDITIQKPEYIAPQQLSEFSKGLDNKYNNTNSKIDKFMSYPAKPIDEIINLLKQKSYEKIYFFDIFSLTSALEYQRREFDAYLLENLLEYSSQLTHRYLEHHIILKCCEVSRDINHHAYSHIIKANNKSDLLKSLIEFISGEYSAFYNDHKSVSEVFKDYGLYYFFESDIKKFTQYLFNAIQEKRYYSLINTIKQNIFNFYSINQVQDMADKMVELLLSVEDKDGEYFEFIKSLIVSNLGSIDISDSNWYKYDIDEGTKEKYRKLEGVFGFRKFVEIAKYLESSGYLDNNAAKQLLNRALFWKNYEERFTSVNMWLSKEQNTKLFNDINDNNINYKITIDDLDDIKNLKGMENEVCVIHIEEQKILVIDFFRNRVNDNNYHTMIFEGLNVKKILKELNNKHFTNELYNNLKKDANYFIFHPFGWQGYVEEFLSKQLIYPNISILDGKNKFQVHEGWSDYYNKEVGLESSREKTECGYDDVIQQNKLTIRSDKSKVSILKKDIQEWKIYNNCKPIDQIEIYKLKKDNDIELPSIQQLNEMNIAIPLECNGFFWLEDGKSIYSIENRVKYLVSDDGEYPIIYKGSIIDQNNISVLKKVVYTENSFLNKINQKSDNSVLKYFKDSGEPLCEKIRTFIDGHYKKTWDRRNNSNYIEVLETFRDTSVGDILENNFRYESGWNKFNDTFKKEINSYPREFIKGISITNHSDTYVLRKNIANKYNDKEILELLYRADATHPNQREIERVVSKRLKRYNV